MFMCFFFFFQAEDGIRDYKVTGVQTCALPICPRHSSADAFRRRRFGGQEHAVRRAFPDGAPATGGARRAQPRKAESSGGRPRTGERGGGEEGEAGWGAAPLKKKKKKNREGRHE